MIQDLTLQQIDELIDMIGIIHEKSQNTLLPILKKLKKESAYEPINDELDILKTWYSKPEDTQQDDNYKVAKIFTYVVLKKLKCEHLVQ